MKPSVDIHFDYIVIEDYTVPRPAKISPTQWFEFWCKLGQRDENEIYNAGFEAGQLEPLD
jgi:hypothetical protein